MQRRTFLKQTLTSSVFFSVVPAVGQSVLSPPVAAPLDALDATFLNPPGSARPWVFWMWMNGNITKEGITADLEAMKRMGIGGVINFNSATGIPPGSIRYGSKEWLEATAHAAAECGRLGLEITLHNSPGYSGAGGPWISPEMSMQQLVWTETVVTSTGKVQLQLPKPVAKHGYYRDAYVIAYPSLPVEKAIMKDKLVRVLVNGKEIDKNRLTDGSTETKIRLETPDGTAGHIPAEATNYDIAGGSATGSGSTTTGTPLSLVLEFAEPFEARAITILRRPEIPHDLFDGPRDHPPLMFLESSQDGLNYTRIGTIHSPELRHMDTPSVLSFTSVTAKYYRLLLTGPSWITDVELYNGPRLGGWPGKASYTHGEFGGETPAVSNELLIDPSTVLDISGKMTADGTLTWEAAAGRWTILRMGHTTTGEETFAQPDGANGLQLDKFRKEALDFHFTHFLDNVLDSLKASLGKGFKGFTVDSWEAGKQNWSIDFPDEFKKRQHYEITPWMPALTGRLVGSVTDTERFLWDVRKTQANLLSDNFYGHFAKLCHQRGLIFNAEPYGDGNFDSLQVNQHLDIPMAEFWTRYIYGSDIYSKQAVSAGRIYGKKVVAAEAFTAMPATSKWTDYPYSLKAEGDYFFSLGINRLVFHTFVHQPYNTAKPGMTMGPFGMHIDRNNTWTEQANGWIGYLNRAQALLQQGIAVSDVCYVKGDTPQSGVPDVYSFLPAGYTGDVMSTDALQRVRIESKTIVLPDDMRYRLCILASLDAILPTTLSLLSKLVAEGMILLVNNKPTKALGRSFQDEDVVKITANLYGNLDGKTVTERTVGTGKIIWGKPLNQVLTELGLQPDFTYTTKNGDASIHYIHKVIGETEFYFVSNHKRRRENLVCSFRITGKQPELWNPETGERCEAALFETIDHRMHLSLSLEPAGALFIVFRKKVTQPGYTAVSREGVQLLTTRPFPLPPAAIYADVQTNFTITAWIKPDTYAHPNRSMLFHAPAGELLYGSGHVACGLSAGQNGVRLYERGRGPAQTVLVSSQPIEGWTHLAVVYQNGLPTIYLNGTKTGSLVEKKQDNIVHPGLGTPAAQEQFASYFEGNFTTPQLYREPLTTNRIEQLVAQGLPDPDEDAPINIKREVNGNLTALIWQDGTYQIRWNGGGNPKILTIKNSCRILPISGAWTVDFPKGLGAPAAIELPNLMSLHKHPEFDVKHFSGTATYRKNITIRSADLGTNKKLYLDLGRVEVIAEVTLNGKPVGQVWKEPFRLEITDLAKAGINKLEIKVTNLWPNRLIGDEHLPVENAYSPDRFILKLPDWYRQNKPKPGKRVTFSVWHNIEKTDPLLESGLLGPVRLLRAVKTKI